MDWNYVNEKNGYLVTLENGKKYHINQDYVDNAMKDLDIGEFEAVEMWLDDNEILELSQEQLDLDTKAKENKSNKIISAGGAVAKPKTQRERVKKDNPDKEFLIDYFRTSLEKIEGISALNVVNKGKIIEFTYKGKEFKIDLIEKRVKKEK